MARTRSVSGEMVQGTRPDWGPLLQVAGEDVTGGFMWMYEVQLAGGRYVQAYKHYDTRRYMFLDGGCNAFAYVGDGRYAPVAVADALEAALSPWWEYLDASIEETATCWIAIARATRFPRSARS
jgi:hypothetical protein